MRVRKRTLFNPIKCSLSSDELYRFSSHKDYIYNDLSCYRGDPSLPCEYGFPEVFEHLTLVQTRRFQHQSPTDFIMWGSTEGWATPNMQEYIQEPSGPFGTGLHSSFGAKGNTCAHELILLSVLVKEAREYSCTHDLCIIVFSLSCIYSFDVCVLNWRQTRADT